MTLTYLLFYIDPLAVTPPLTSPLLSPFSYCLVSGKCFRTWVLITYHCTNHPFFCGLSPQRTIFYFQKACWDEFAFYFDSHYSSAEEYLSLFLSSAAALFTSLTLNAAKTSIRFGRIKRHPKAWWSAEVEEAVSERCKAFAAAHRSDQNCQAYIFASRRASSVIAKAKAEKWQVTCSYLSPKSTTKSVYFLLRSVAGSSFSSPNFPNCSSPSDSASVFADQLRSHFSTCIS